MKVPWEEKEKSSRTLTKIRRPLKLKRDVNFKLTRPNLALEAMKCPNPECRVSDLPDTHLFCFECGAKITHPDKQRNKQTASNVNQEQIDSTHAVESVTGNESSKFKL